MAKKDPKLMAETLVKLFGKGNILSYTNCMTRFRAKVKSVENVDINGIKKIPNVMGVVENGQEIQVILGPGFVRKTTEQVSALYPEIKFNGEIGNDNLSDTESLASVAASNKAAQKASNTSPIQQFMAKFSNIFSPLIFGFIGAGILAGIGGILQTSFDSTGTWTNVVAESWFQIFSVFLNLWKQAFIIIVGWRTAEVFGGVGVIGGIAATMFVGSFSAIYTAPFISQGVDGFTFLGIHITDPLTNWLTIGFRPSQAVDGTYSLSYASGAVFGAMMMAFISVPIIKGIRKITPDVLDMVMSSTLTFLVLLFIGYALIIPISGILFSIVASLFSNLATNPFGAAVLAGIFLLAVVFGIHQGFVPVYAALISQTGINSLFAILAMGGAGQVGVSLALYFKAEEGSVIRNQIKGAIIPGFLGIGEPLIYGVTLPRPKTFVAAMLGAAVGGFFLGAMSTWGGLTVGLNTMFGPSGLLAAPMMIGKFGGTIGHVGGAISIYMVALIFSYLSGFGFTYLIGTKGVDLL